MPEFVKLEYRFDVVTIECCNSSEDKMVLTIYTGKPEISVGKSSGSRHSVRKASGNTGCHLR